MTKEELFTLEALIDRHGLIKVLAGIEEICLDKAAHIASAWQDTRTAKHWANASATVGGAASKVSV